MFIIIINAYSDYLANAMMSIMFGFKVSQCWIRHYKCLFKKEEAYLVKELWHCYDGNEAMITLEYYLYRLKLHEKSNICVSCSVPLKGTPFYK